MYYMTTCTCTKLQIHVAGLHVFVAIHVYRALTKMAANPRAKLAGSGTSASSMR